MRRLISVLLLGLLGIACGLAPAHAQPVYEASAADVTAGTKGAPYYVSPRRLAAVSQGVSLTSLVTWSAGTDYAQGAHVSHNGSTWFANTDPTTGEEPGVASDWVVVAEKGDTGPAGADGPGYAATSTTSRTIASSGSIVLTTQSGLAYSAGARVRIASAATPTNWMEGLVASYSGTTLTFTADKSNGSGTLSDWNINLAGQPGADGSSGSGTGDMLKSEYDSNDDGEIDDGAIPSTITRDAEAAAAYLGINAQAADVDPDGSAIGPALALKADASSLGTIASLPAPVLTDLSTGTELARSAMPYQHYWRDIAGSVTLTDAAGTPSEGHGHVLTLKADGAARTVTIPSSYSEARGQNITSIALAANEQRTLTRRYLDGAWTIIGDAPIMTKQIGTNASPDTTGGAVTVSDAVNGVVLCANTATAYTIENCEAWVGKVLAVRNCGTNTITLNPDDSDVIEMSDGTLLTAGDSITISNTRGSRVVLFSSGANRIEVWGYSGTITDAN
jgi:hypothetical protein